MDSVIGAVVGICFFFIPVWAYRRGLNDGLGLNQGKPIKPIQTPMEAVEQHKAKKQDRKSMDNMMQGLNNILAYDGSPQEVKKVD